MGHIHSMPGKPCLIFNNYALRTNDGGPSGFLAQNLSGFSSPLYYLGANHYGNQGSVWKSRWRKVSRYERRTLRKLGLLEAGRYGPWALQGRQNFACESAASYPWIWFHDAFNLSMCLDLIPPWQKVILQPHCPLWPSEEVADTKKTSPEIVAWAKNAELRAFNRADVCVFPNEEAGMIYDGLLNPRTRVEYLMSGCKEMVPRHELPLDPKWIYFLYMGRRIPIKGFDIVLEAFQKAYEKDPTLRLLLAGSGDTVRSPGVIDLGHVPEPANWLAACDYLVSANRQSYFDLSVMEALSLGTPLIIACTGGHRKFMELDSPGVIPLTTAEPHAFTQAMLNNSRKRPANQQGTDANRGLYRDYFSDSQYRARLDLLLSHLFAN